MHSTSVFALVILAIFTLCLASATPAGTNKVPDRETAGQVARRFEPHAFDQNTASPNPSAVVKRTMQLDCTRNHLCDSVVTENMCLTAFDMIVDDTSYRTGISPEHTGTCFGNALGVGCSVSIQGRGCTISGRDLRGVFLGIRRHGCLKCGWAQDPGTGCVVRIDSVNRCWEWGPSSFADGPVRLQKGPRSEGLS